MGPGVAMAMPECAASLPRLGAASAGVSASRASRAGWASFSTRGSGRRGGSGVKQCEPNRGRRAAVARAEVGEQGAPGGGGTDRAAVMGDSKRLLAMQKELLDQVRNFSFPLQRHPSIAIEPKLISPKTFLRTLSLLAIFNLRAPLAQKYFLFFNCVLHCRFHSWICSQYADIVSIWRSLG